MYKISRYVYKKLIGAGFALSIFSCIIFLMNGFDMYDLSETLQSPWIWIAFYPYAIFASVIVDMLAQTKLLSAEKPRYFTLICYQLFGLIPFLIIMFPSLPLILIAGIVGIIFASLFYVGMLLIVPNKKTSIAFAWILPALLVVVMLTDFTVKTNWQEVRTDSLYQVNFDYLNGKHKIPFELQKNDTMTFQVKTYAKNDGGWGDYVEAPHKKQLSQELIAATESNVPDKIQFTAPEAGTYYIVVTGDKLRGAFIVEWTIRSNVEQGALINE